MNFEDEMEFFDVVCTYDKNDNKDIDFIEKCEYDPLKICVGCPYGYEIYGEL